MLKALRFTPGIIKEVTPYSNERGWIDCDKVRFRNGYPETIGGWTRFDSLNDPLEGTARNLYTWAALDGQKYLSVGTNEKFYIYQGGQRNDVTPIRETTAAGDVTFAATDGSSEIVVTDVDHGAIDGDWVTFSGASSLGGNVTADVLNAEHQITSVSSDDTYVITVSVTANSSDTGNGGASVVGEYQINIGLDTGISGLGWGAGTWGSGGWSLPAVLAADAADLRVWSQDNFGEDLVFNPRGGDIYYWDETNPETRGVPLADLSGANKAPTIASFIMVSDQDRHVIAFGCDDEFNIGTQDSLLIRFSDQENVADWETLTTNTAGSIRLSSGSEIITAVQTRREILVFTDTSLHSMQFIGPPFTFGINELARNVQIVGPNAAISANDVVFWMARGKFMMFDGRVNEIPCTVKEHVFNNINTIQYSKVVCGHLARFSEIWWFYPTSEENDRYVVYNYQDNVWYIGTLARTAMVDRGLFEYPMMTSPSGEIYFHEFGLNDGSTNPATGIDAFIESAPMDVEDGDSFVFATRVVPDITFRNSEGTPRGTLTIKAHEFVGVDYDQTYPNSILRTATSPVEEFTEQVYIRLRGRAFNLKFESSEESTAWRLGTMRLDYRMDGRR